MAYPTAAEFQAELTARPLAEIVNQYFFQGVPFAFRTNPRTLDILNGHLTAALGVATEDITVVGSAKIGFSTSPDDFPRAFSAQSDIDVIVVNSDLFDQAWYTVLHWHYRRRRLLAGPERQWMWDRRQNFYYGWISPQEITWSFLTPQGDLRALLDLRVRWFNAFKSLSRYAQLSRRRISGRLYRTWDHARLYHTDSLRQLTETLYPAQGA